MQDKPIAFINEVSQIRDESEVMLPMGIVFRTASYEEVNDNSKHSVKIKMVRGKDEKQIEKDLSRFHLLEQTGVSCLTLGLAIVLKSTRNCQHVGQYYCNAMSDALKSSDTQLAEQLSALSNSNVQPVLTPNNVVEPSTNNLLNGPVEQ
ncbi:unnamed protein product, partial [Didymodactylos carnosus]